MARRFQLSVVLLAGLVVGLAFGYGSAWGLGGGGHGWNSSFWSVLVVFLLPMLGVGFLTEDSGCVRRTAWYVTIGFITLDAVLASATSLEGWSGMGRVLEAAPGRLAAWLMIWIAFHFSIVLLWRKRFALSGRGASSIGGPAGQSANRGGTS